MFDRTWHGVVGALSGWPGVGALGDAMPQVAAVAGFCAAVGGVLWLVRRRKAERPPDERSAPSRQPRPSQDPPLVATILELWNADAPTDERDG